jgi:hypothetical protein
LSTTSSRHSSPLPSTNTTLCCMTGWRVYCVRAGQLAQALYMWPWPLC